MPDSSTACPTVRADSYLTLHYRVALTSRESETMFGKRLDASEIVSTFHDKPATLQLGAGQFAPALEAHLVGLLSGERALFEFAAGVAFGPRNPALIKRVSRAVLDAESDGAGEYLPGDVVEFNAPGGGCYAGVFKEGNADYALFDFNHPLAGRAVRFEVEIIGIL